MWVETDVGDMEDYWATKFENRLGTTVGIAKEGGSCGGHVSLLNLQQKIDGQRRDWIPQSYTTLATRQG